MARTMWGLGAASRAELHWSGFCGCWSDVWYRSPLGPDIICRWWTSAITVAISWLQGDDSAVRAYFTEVERVPKALEVTECVSLLDYFLASLRETPNAGCARPACLG